MGRPREFDPDEVLDAAQEAFWTHGYEGTSIHDLLEATGLQRGSLYKAFGDKHGLYVRTLERYQAAARSSVAEALNSPQGAYAGLRQWLRSAAEGCEDGGRMGCFVVNSTIELSPHDEPVEALLETHRKELVALLRTSVGRAQKDGDLREDLDPGEVARHLVLVACGLAVDSRGGSSTRQRRQQADLALRLLE